MKQNYQKCWNEQSNSLSNGKQLVKASFPSSELFGVSLIFLDGFEKMCDIFEILGHVFETGCVLVWTEW